MFQIKSNYQNNLKKNTSHVNLSIKKNMSLNIPFSDELKPIIKNYMSLNIPFSGKKKVNSIIPLNLYTCWHSKILPPYLNYLYESIKKDNPEFNHYLYDEEMCADFIKKNFPEKVFYAYNSLIPNAFKADLWRYCILYINGGIYYDIKFSCVNNFKFIYLTENELFIRDRPTNYIYNALIVVKPKNEILKKCIDKIAYNVKNKIYGNDCLSLTGPGLLGSFFTLEEYNSNPNYFLITEKDGKNDKYIIVYNGEIILLSDDILYRKCQNKNQIVPHYGELWHQRRIYK